MELVAVFDDLVCAADEVEVVLVEERLYDGAAEGVRDAPRVVAPTGDGRVGVAPEEITEDAVLGDFRGSFDLGDLRETLEVGAEAAVHAHDFVRDDGADGHGVEAIAKDAPELYGVAPLALVEETVDAIQGRALVVSAEQKKILRIRDLVAEQQGNGLDTLLGPVDIIAHEDVVALRWKAPHLEEPQEIVVLTVRVPADVYRRAHLHEHRLAQEHLPRPTAHEDYVLLRQVHLRTGLLPAHAQQSPDARQHATVDLRQWLFFQRIIATANHLLLSRTKTNRKERPVVGAILCLCVLFFSLGGGGGGGGEQTTKSAKEDTLFHLPPHCVSFTGPHRVKLTFPSRRRWTNTTFPSYVPSSTSA